MPEVLPTRAKAQTRDRGVDDGLLCYIRGSCTEPDETVKVLLQGGPFLLQVVEVTGVDYFRLRRPKRSSELPSELIPSVDVSIWKVGIPVLSKAFQRKDECFDLASRAASGCFDGRFVLEEEVFWVGVPIELW